ncbi:MAG: helix-turn-helix domain-containing protein [Treponema sp.]|nr:helix-turn-helix domain-containing protein [Treponema sp.]
MSSQVTGSELGIGNIRGHLVSVKDVAELLNISKRLVYRRLKENKFPIPIYVIGPRNRGVDSADLDEWLGKVSGKENVEKPRKTVRRKK